ncbi:MAG TPA: YdeI/OmpD-associated family protein [Polyangia bacterium]
MTKFRAKVVPIKGGGHYVVVPEDVAEKAKLQYGARVRGTVEGVAYRSSLMKYSGIFHMGVHKATLTAAKAKAGDVLAITLELDDAPLPGDTLPPELARAFKSNAVAKAAWDKLAPSHRREHVKAIEEAKKPETRTARIDRTLAMLAGDKK